MSRSFRTWLCGLLAVFLLLPAQAVRAEPVDNHGVMPTAPRHSLQAQDLAAVAEEIESTVALRKSFSDEQVAAVRELLAKHRPALQAIQNDLLSTGVPAGQTQKFFLPLINGGAQNQPAAPVSPNLTAEQLQALRVAMARTASVYRTLHQEMDALLTAEQKALHATGTRRLQKIAFESSTQLGRLAPAAPADTDGLSDCFYGAYYGAAAFYWGWYALLELEDFYFQWGGSYYSYDAYYYAYYAFVNIYYGLPYAGGAYFNVYNGFGYDDYWSNEAYYYFDYGAYDAYWAYYYGYFGWYYTGSDYAYYGFLDAYYTYDYAESADDYMLSC